MVTMHWLYEKPPVYLRSWLKLNELKTITFVLVVDIASKEIKEIILPLNIHLHVSL